MDFSDEILLQVEELSGLFLNPEEISVILDLNQDEFYRQLRLKKGLLYHAYFKGKTISKKEIHANVVKMAKHGSPLAEDLSRKLLIEQETSERASIK